MFDLIYAFVMGFTFGSVCVILIEENLATNGYYLATAYVGIYLFFVGIGLLLIVHDRAALLGISMLAGCTIGPLVSYGLYRYN